MSLREGIDGTGRMTRACRRIGISDRAFAEAERASSRRSRR